MVNEFCQILSEYGYEIGIYANQDYIQNKFKAPSALFM